MAGSAQYLTHSSVVLTTAWENQRRSNPERLCVLKAWLRIEHRLPDSPLYINILRSHCYLQGFPCRRLLENPEQVKTSDPLIRPAVADNGTLPEGEEDTHSGRYYCSPGAMHRFSNWQWVSFLRWRKCFFFLSTLKICSVSLSAPQVLSP